MKTSFWKQQGVILIALVCAFILIVISLFGFVSGVNKDARQGMKMQTEVIRDNYVRILTSELVYLKSMTEITANFFDELGSETDDDIVLKLKKYAKIGNIERTLFVSDNGNTYTNYAGYLGDINKNKSLDGILLSDIYESIFSKPFYAEELDKVVFGVVTPTIIGTQKGVLVSSYDVERFRELFKNNFLDGGSHVGIVDKNGDVVIGENADFKPTKFGVNICDEFTENQVKFFEGSAKSIKEDLLNGKDGFIIYDCDGIQRYCSYAPVGINDWYIFAMAPENVLTGQVESIKNRGIQLTFALLFIMSALLLAVVAIRHRDQWRTRKELEKAATIDGLTKIYNRAATERNIIEYLSGEGANGSHALFAMDVDGFKQINDSYGHLVGDVVLIEFAKQIKTILDEDDIVGRMGGDEFIALLKNCDDLEVIHSKAEKIVQTLAKEQDVDLLTISTTISIGIALFPADGNTFIALYQHADDALYKTKQQGKNGFSFYERY